MSDQQTEPAGPSCDVIIRRGTVYDGTGAAGVRTDVALHDGKVLAHGTNLPHQGTREVDAEGCWVMPGLIDIHTHYDAEIEVMPGLEESVRHGVTSVVMGNCSLSTALGQEKDLLDLFCRVESLPREVMLSWLGNRVDWHDVREYYDHLDRIPMGPNVSSFVGHSNIRFTAMGMVRSLTVPQAEEKELSQMQGIVDEAMQAGYLGMSIDMLPWHRMDGEPYNGTSVPSQQAHPSEYRRLANVVREHERVVQATPNALTKSTIINLVKMSTGVFRKPLRMTIVAAMDVKTNRAAYKMATYGAAVANKLFRANVRWQALAEPFLNYCDGVKTPLFEEFSTGVEAISADSETRKGFFRDPAFRSQFRSQWESTGEKVFHRDLSDMFVVASPDDSHVDKSFQQIADETGADPLELFMDLLAEHDEAIRWKTVVTNDRADKRRWIFAHPTTIPGFNDSGAHNRNMAFQDGGLQMLQQVLLHPELMPVETAVHKLTKMTADWLGMETGSIRSGDWADLVVIDPEKLKTGLGAPIEHYDPRLEGAMRMVKRSDGVVRNVFVGGRLAFEDGQFSENFGKERFGRLLKSKH